jgi:hypothetical protein
MLVLMPFLFINSNKNNDSVGDKNSLAVNQKQNDTKLVGPTNEKASDTINVNQTNTVVSTNKEIIDSSASIIKNEKKIADLKTINQSTTASVHLNKKNNANSIKTIPLIVKKKEDKDSIKSMVTAVNKNASVIVKNKKKETKDSTKSNSVAVNKNAVVAVKPVTAVTTKEKETKSTKTPKIKEEKGEAKETKSNVKPILNAKKTDEVVKPNENIVSNINTTSDLVDSIKVAPVKKDSIAATIVIAKKDSLPKEEVKPIVKPDSTNKPQSAWIFSLEAGINGFLSGGKGLSPIAGVTITKSLNEKWEIGTGAYYTYIPTYTGVSTFTTAANYDFGYTFKLTELVTQKLHYAAVPLFVKYNFNKNNSVIAGANFYYLFNSSNLITTYDISYAGIQNKVTQKASGYFSSFSPYDIGLMGGYKRKINKKCGVALYVNYGLMSLQKTQTISTTNIHNNISGQLLFTYKLFKD